MCSEVEADLFAAMRKAKRGDKRALFKLFLDQEEENTGSLIESWHRESEGMAIPRVQTPASGRPESRQRPSSQKAEVAEAEASVDALLQLAKENMAMARQASAEGRTRRILAEKNPAPEAASEVEDAAPAPDAAPEAASEVEEAAPAPDAAPEAPSEVEEAAPAPDAAPEAAPEELRIEQEQEPELEVAAEAEALPVVEPEVVVAEARMATPEPLSEQVVNPEESPVGLEPVEADMPEAGPDAEPQGKQES